MSDARVRLLKAIVSPLEDDEELRLVSRQEVGEILDPDIDESCAQSIAARLRMRVSRVWVLLGLAMVAFISSPLIHWALIKEGGGVVKTLQGSSEIAYGISGSADGGSSWRQGLSNHERLLLFGAPGAEGANQWRPLWESDPDNAMFYQEYVSAYRQEHEALPIDVLEVGDQVDPGNGWYRMLEAIQEMDLLVETESIPESDVQVGDAKPTTILDEEVFRERMELLHAACRAPRLKDHAGDLARQRFEVMSPTEDMISLMQNYALIVTYQRFFSYIRGISDLMAAEAQRCQRQSDKEGFEALAQTWHRFVATRMDDSVGLLDGFLVQAFMLATLPSMRDAAVALEVNGDAWANLEKEARERKQRLSAGKVDDALITHHGSYLASLILPMLQRSMEEPPRITGEALLPSVRVEQAFLARALSGLGWLILGVVLLVSLGVSYGTPKVIKLLARHLCRILKVKDWILIMLGGVFCPLLLFLVIRYGTPFARLDWGPRLTMYLIPFGHMVALLFMWLVWPIIFVVWRLEKRGGVFGWTLRKRPLAMAALVSPPVGMVLLGLTVPIGGQTLPLLGLACLAGVVALVWGVIRPGWGGCRGFGRGLQRSTLSVACRPAWLGAMAGFALFSIFFAAEERRWITRDEWLKPTPEMTAYESKAAQQMIVELRALIEASFSEQSGP